jgi:hypothetical protein
MFQHDFDSTSKTRVSLTQRALPSQYAKVLIVWVVPASHSAPLLPSPATKGFIEPLELNHLSRLKILTLHRGTIESSC